MEHKAAAVGHAAPGYVATHCSFGHVVTVALVERRKFCKNSQVPYLAMLKCILFTYVL